MVGVTKDEMNQIRVIHERRDKDGGSNYKVQRSLLQVDSLEINNQGSKAADYAKIHTRSKFLNFQGKSVSGGLKNGDEIAVVIDDVDTTNLVGAYNFYFNLRDESGYNIDGYMNGGTETYGIQRDEDSRFQGHKYLDGADNSMSVKLVQSTQEANANVINFRAGCEIQLMIKTPATLSSGRQVIFSRLDNRFGIEIGIEKLSSKYYMFCNTRTDNSKSDSVSYDAKSNYDSSNNADPDDDLEVNLDKEYFIRVHRLHDDRMIGNPYHTQETCRFNMTIESNEATLPATKGQQNFLHHHSNNDLDDFDEIKFMEYGAHDNPNTVIPAFFMSNQAGGENFRGRLYGARIYTKALEDWQWTRAYKRLVPTNTMKFAGKIDSANLGWDGTSEVVVLSYGKLLLHTEIDGQLFTDADSSIIKDQRLETTIEDIITRYNATKVDVQGAGTGHLGKDVKFQWMFSNEGYISNSGATTGNEYKNEDDYTTTGSGAKNWKDIDHADHKYSPRHIMSLVPSGSILEYCRILAILGGKEYNTAQTAFEHFNGADQFFVLPRKVLVFESSDIDNHCYLSTSRDCKAQNLGNNSSKVFNDVTVFGKGEVESMKVGLPQIQEGGTYIPTLPSGTGQKQIVGVQVFRTLGTGVRDDTYGELVRADGVTASWADYEWDGNRFRFNKTFDNTGGIRDSQTTGSTEIILGKDGYYYSRIGVIIQGSNSAIGQTIDTIRFCMKKVGDPDGTFQFRVYDSDGDLVAKCQPQPVSVGQGYDTNAGGGIPTSYTDGNGDIQYVTQNINEVNGVSASTYTIQEDDRFVCEWVTGTLNDTNNYIKMKEDSAHSSTKETTRYGTASSNQWNESRNNTVLFKLERAVGVGNNSLEIIFHYLNMNSYDDVDGDHASKDEEGTLFKRKHEVSIKEIGLRTLAVYVPQMEDINTTASLCRRMLASSAEAKDRVEVINPKISIGFNVGTKVNLYSDAHNIKGKDYVVQAIKYSVPEMKTYIQLGEHNYDFLDKMEAALQYIRAQEKTGEEGNKFPLVTLQGIVPAP